MRPIKLDFYDHPFTCPICKAEIVFTSMQVKIVSSRRACPACKGELLIHEGVATPTSAKKPPKQAKKRAVLGATARRG